ncbi:MAG TPA: YhdP family protein, partial [Woeseiaceae bacterium]|nr:YhdP family protein [Woeseiaceae bacterium]
MGEAKRWLRKLFKYAAYCGAAVVILLAIGVGLFRLMLPKLPAYQEEIKLWANSAIGMRVEFSGMNARWRLSGPELTFYNAQLATDGRAGVLHAEEVSVGVELLRLILDLEMVADRVLIRDAEVQVSQREDGSWEVQGMPLAELRLSPSGEGRGALVVVGEDIAVDVALAHRAEPVTLDVESIQFRRTATQQDIDASLVLPEAFGAGLDVAASQRLADAAPAGPWRLFVEGDGLDAAALSGLWPDAPQLASGMAELELWVELQDGSARSATANFVLTEVVASAAGASATETTDAPFSAQGRLEFSRDDGGWLLAADEFVMTTANGQWPESSLTVRATSDDTGELERVQGRATWFDFAILRHAAVLIPADYRATLAELALTGVVRDVELTIVEPSSPDRRFNGTAHLERVGMAPWRGLPGLRGFSGSLRADQAGGRLEINAADLQFSLPDWFAEPFAVSLAAGTVIWRHGEAGTTILSDSVRVATAEIDSRSSLQVTLPEDGSSPVLDLQSRWQASSIAAIERYLPVHVMKPGLYRWLGDALVAGEVTSATTRFSGPLRAFPFDDGEGTFQTEAQVENAVLRYAGSWPAVENVDANLVIDNMRLYSGDNSAASAGNRVVDARVEIPDLRKPLLLIDAQATGTLASIHRFARQSPIDSLFGGHLERVAAEGGASFHLQLRYPILRREDYAFNAALRSDNGTVRIEGLPAPITDIQGGVAITRDTLYSDALIGRFLGSPITIDLARAGDGMPGRSVIAKARGSITAGALLEGLGVPLEDRLQGSTTYDATVSFPRPGIEDPAPLSIAIESDLNGLAVELPEPLGKSADTVRLLSLELAFPQAGKIAASGKLSDTAEWSLAFDRMEAGWDLDRGMVALGGAAPGEPESRGLHIEGYTPRLDVDAWLALAATGTGEAGYGERIRSMDLVADDLLVIGQQLSRHRLVLDRSAFDWVVQLEGAEIVGSVRLPYDFAGGRPIELDMQKLTLPGGHDAAARDRLADPRTLPPIVVQADEFSLGNRHLGSLTAEFARTGRGLVAETIETSNATFGIIGSARWVVDESDQTGQRTFVSGRLTSSDVLQTLQQLDYQPGIESEAMDVQFDVSWSGGPRQDFLGSLDGSVAVRFGTGQLNEIEPGAGRVFGLMSVVALPRRLSLDFSDVFDRGFGFDEITGNFRLEDGQAYTCDLSLKGPAADVGIVG